MFISLCCLLLYYKIKEEENDMKYIPLANLDEIYVMDYEAYLVRKENFLKRY